MEIDKEYWKIFLDESQRCQRNWDLSKTIPKEDIDLMINAVKSAPSKQNEKHFQVSIITDFEQRYQIYHATHNFAYGEDGVSVPRLPNGEINYKRQSQLIGNVLFVFSREKNDLYRSGESHAGGPYVTEDKNVKQAGRCDISTPELKKGLQEQYGRHVMISTGVAAGYLLLTARLLGYKTGGSCGFNREATERITKVSHPELIIAVGFGDPTRNRREEHFEKGRLFPKYDKDIKVTWISQSNPQTLV